MIPGMKNVSKNANAMQLAENELKKTIAIINSMTPKERKNHTLLNGSRRKRVARGSGNRVEDVNKMIKNFMQMQKMMKNMGKMGKFANKMMRHM